MAKRQLSEAEQRRLDQFNSTSDKLVSQGYQRVNLDVSIVAANAVAIAVTIVLFAVVIALFAIAHPDAWFFLPMVEAFVVIGVFLVLIVVHELIHGFTWSRFAPNGFKDVEFGIMRDSLTPYCACLVPLRKGPYILGALMPLVILGIIPMAIAFATGFVPLLYIGVLMTVSAVGDVMIVVKVLRHHPPSDDMLLFDHPTDAGSVVFER